jgi:hypothetical protein
MQPAVELNHTGPVCCGGGVHMLPNIEVAPTSMWRVVVMIFLRNAAAIMQCFTLRHTHTQHRQLA